MFRKVFSNGNLNKLPYLLVKRNAGHNKWSNIKHIKGAKDAQRSLLFTRLSRYMKVAITEGGGTDPAHNLKLEQVLEQAKRANMPSATIQSIIKSTQTNKQLCKMYNLEIKGPGGCIIVVEVFTEALHHSKQSVATIIKKYSCKFSDGGAKHLFQEKGIIEIETPKDMMNLSKEKLEEAMTDHAIEVGAEEVHVDDETLDVLFHSDAGSLNKVVKELEKKFVVLSASVEHYPLKYQTLTEQEMESCRNMYERLEKLPEVINIYDNIA